MKIVLAILIISNVIAWLYITVLIDVFKRNEAMTDADRERNTNRYYELAHELAALRKVVEKYIIEH